MNQGDQSSRPEPLVRPPRLHLGREGTASRLELFFDLAYVLVVLELAKVFYEDLTWHGAAVLAGLFVTIWFSWVGFTLYANRFDTDDVVFRIAKLIATGSIAGCAASASDAAGKLAVPFAACYLGSQLVLLALYVRAWRHVQEARPTVRVYLLTVGLSAALWAVSLVVPSPARYLLWAIAVLVSAGGPVLATLRSDKFPLHIEHLPERFALLVILVLGEAVGSAARGVHERPGRRFPSESACLGSRSRPASGGSTSTSPRRAVPESCMMSGKRRTGSRARTQGTPTATSATPGTTYSSTVTCR